MMDGVLRLRCRLREGSQVKATDHPRVVGDVALFGPLGICNGLWIRRGVAAITLDDGHMVLLVQFF